MDLPSGHRSEGCIPTPSSVSRITQDAIFASIAMYERLDGRWLTHSEFGTPLASTFCYAPRLASQNRPPALLNRMLELRSAPALKSSRQKGHSDRVIERRSSDRIQRSLRSRIFRRSRRKLMLQMSQSFHAKHLGLNSSTGIGMGTFCLHQYLFLLSIRARFQL